MSRRTMPSPILHCLRTLAGFNSRQLHYISTSASQKSSLSYLAPSGRVISNHVHGNATGLSRTSRTTFASRQQTLNATNIATQQRRDISTEEDIITPTSTDIGRATPTNSESNPKPRRKAEPHHSKSNSKSDPSLSSKAKINPKWPVWRIQKEALKSKFEEGWAPRKRLSPDAMEGVRELHAKDPVKFSTPVLAQEFKVSPEAIRRILKSKWRPSEKEAVDRRGRWEKRETRIWDHMVQVGLRPERIENPETGVKKLKRKPVWSKKR